MDTGLWAAATISDSGIRGFFDEQGLSLTGSDELLKQFTQTVLETALNEAESFRVEHHRGGRGPGPRAAARLAKSPIR